MKNIINRIKNDKVLFSLSILIIGVFLVLIIRITYSYLAAFINEARENVTIGSDTVDEFKFIEGEAIDLNVTPTTLPEGGGNYSQSTTYKASLLANSTNDSAEESYYVYFNITENTLQYIEEGSPEVILSVFQGETEITNIDGLTYGTYNGVAGFDITTITGLYTIASDYAITSNSSENATIQDWTFTLTYLNQNYDQSGNYGNNMNVEFIMTKDERTVTLAEYITDYVYVEDGVNSLYYHDGQGTYTNADQEAGDNSYRYSGANPNNYVCFGSDEDTCSYNNLYRIIGVFDGQVKLIKADYATIDELGTNGDYHSNYEAFWGSTSTYKGTIGLSQIGVYNWNGGTSTNIWSESQLNTLNLNSNFLNIFSSIWQNKIAIINWQVGGMTWNRLATAKQYYDTEIESSSSISTTYNAKIGLMYVSDYGYAMDPSGWTTNLESYDYASNNNWMYMGLNEWFISRCSDDFNNAFIMFSIGSVSLGYDYVDTDADATRPCFYLTSTTQYVSGTGTQADPYRIV